MKKFTPLVLLASILLCGCARHYTITMNNGSQITSKGKPKFQNGAYYFKDARGQTTMVPAGRVREVAPSSMVEAPDSQYGR